MELKAVSRKEKLLLCIIELQVSYRVCRKEQKEGVLWEKIEAIGKILRQLCEWKGVEIHEASVG